MNTWRIFFLLLAPIAGLSQWKAHKLINDGKDTINRIDLLDKKQGEWVVRYDNVRGEPGYEEEGVFKNSRKEGEWRLFNLMGDLIGIENYRWGNKDGIAQYFTTQGGLRLEQSWKALNPDRAYDTIQVEDIDRLNAFHEVIVKNEGASLKHGTWKYYDPNNGSLSSTESYILGKLEKGAATTAAEPATPKKIAKPKEVMEFEKSKKGKKIRYQDGTTN